MRLWSRCRNPMGGMSWPDGRGLIHQPVLLVQAFDVIAATHGEYIAEKGRR